jgi:chorismate mutase
MNLEEHRFNLEELTQTFLETWISRKELVGQITALKKSGNFDPIQERALFNEFSSILKKFEVEELLSFSLMMQSHVRTYGKYPNWFQGEHLNMEPEFIFERINPILLEKTRPDLYNKLELSTEFQNLL